MNHVSEARQFDSPFVHSISRTQFQSAGETLMQPDGCWDIVVFNRDGDVSVLRTGLTTRSVVHRHEAGDEILVISFEPSSFMASMPGDAMRDEGVLLEKFGKRGFRIGGDWRQIPTFDNADIFVERLVRDGIVESNDLVASIVAGRPKATTERTMQRHFLKTTGLTYKHFTIVERARKAVALLQMGRPASDVAFALGYADQAHLINSLKRIMGQTPRQIAGVAGLAADD